MKKIYYFTLFLMLILSSCEPRRKFKLRSSSGAIALTYLDKDYHIGDTPIVDRNNYYWTIIDTFKNH